MKRSALHPMPAYFDRYVNLCDDVEIDQSMETSIEEARNFPLEKWKILGDQVYAPGKWTVRDILQHLIDTERIFAFRALSFARGEKQRLNSYEEDEYARAGKAIDRDLTEIIKELIAVRKSSQLLFRSFTPEMLAQSGQSFKGEYSVAAIGFILAGHQRWHLQVLEERYYPMLG
ncbi:MAG: DinB family protein [Bacteroidota bacterium]